MKRYFLVAMLFFAAQMSYGQMITLPWDINVCRGCRAEIPVDPSTTINQLTTDIKLKLIQDGVEQPDVEFIPALTQPLFQSIQAGTHAIVIRSKGNVILVTTF